MVAVDHEDMGSLVHKRIAERVLDGLKDEKATYFSDIIHDVAEDVRTNEIPNIVFMVLRNTIPLLPTYLPKQELIERLFGFIETHMADLKRSLFSKEFVTNELVLREVTDLFVEEIVTVALHRYQKGELDSGEVRVHRVSWPYDEIDFPFEDDDGMDD